jgi:lysophospholipase L1-like esterase
MKIARDIVTATLFTIFFSNAASACPAIGRLPDYNCDGSSVITVLGDSLVSGFGDTQNNNKGGYVLRAQGRFTEAAFVNQGVPGLRTQQMISKIRKAFATPQTDQLAQSLLTADLVILDLGRNDRWLMGEPSAALRNIKRARELITTQVKALGYSAPLVVTAVLMYPNRGAQGPWVKELDELIIKSGTTDFPADLRFDRVSKRLLSSDAVHPTSKGYDSMAAIFNNYLSTNYKQHAARLRIDEDNDGLYDMFERSKFGTDPMNPDTDGDGIRDGLDNSPVG